MSAKSGSEGAKSIRRPHEVCLELEIQPYVLKFWEAEFPQLSRRIGSKRLYGAEEFQLAVEIKRLLQEDGVTLGDARDAIDRIVSGAAGEDAAEPRITPHAAAGPGPALGVSVVAAIVDDIETTGRNAVLGASESTQAGRELAPPADGSVASHPHAATPELDRPELDSLRAALGAVTQERDAAEGREARAQREVAAERQTSDALRERLSALEGELETARAQRDASTQLFEQASEELSQAQARIERHEAELERSAGRHAELTAALDARRSEQEALARELSQLQTGRDQLSHQLEQRQTALDEASARAAQLAETQRRLQSLQHELKAEQSRTSDALTQVRALQTRLTEDAARHGQLRRDLEREIGALMEEARLLSAEFGGLLASVSADPRPRAESSSGRTAPPAARPARDPSRHPPA